MTRFKNSESERKAQLEAVRRLSAAARGEGDLVELAEESTTAMLRRPFRFMGYTRIEVAFDEDVAKETSSATRTCRPRPTCPEPVARRR